MSSSSAPAEEPEALSSERIARISVTPSEAHLTDRRSRQQLIVTAHGVDGYEHDVTRQAQFQSADAEIADVDRAAVVRPRGKGTTRVAARVFGHAAQAKITVGDLQRPTPVSFTNEVMAIAGKAGCNAGACHGHNSGKGGFKLSLRGYDPTSDHRAMTDPDSGRVDLEDPPESLLLKMPTAQYDHGGGKRFETDTDFYDALEQWIVAGAPSDVGRAPDVERIEVLPESRTLSRPGLSQQLIVRAHFADGAIRDVTHQAIYELSAEGVIDVASDGLVASHREGEAAVFVRFLGKMGLARFLVVRHKPGFVWQAPPGHNFIDERIDAKLKKIQVTPSPPCDDAEFLRRVSLDTVGVPPTPEEVRDFLSDARPDKRARKIDELLDREEFGDQWAMYWLDLSGTSESGGDARFKGIWTLSFWLRDAINRNLPYDRFVRELVSAKGSSLENPAIAFTANRLPKVELVPQLFLGVRLECAQCHDHPFDTWTQADYQSLEKFFVGLGEKEGPHDSYGRELRRFVPPENFLPWERDKTVALELPDGTLVEAPVTRDRRELLVEWMFGPARHQTAEALANRVWGKLFGRGIVDPVDDMRFSNPPVNEPLLDALAENLIQSDWDFKRLVRTILNSRTYQTSSESNETNAGETMNFSRFYLRRLSAEQLLDSICQVTGVDAELRTGPPGIRAVQFPYVNGGRFLTLFGRPGERKSPCECVRSSEATLPQVLSLINGDTVHERLAHENGKISRLISQYDSDPQLAEELYLTILSRFPTQSERDTATTFLRDSPNRDEAARDLAWALLTGQEFLFNH